MNKHKDVKISKLQRRARKDKTEEKAGNCCADGDPLALPLKDVKDKPDGGKRGSQRALESKINMVHCHCHSYDSAGKQDQRKKSKLLYTTCIK